MRYLDHGVHSRCFLQEDEGLHPDPQRPRLELPGLLQGPEVCWAQERSALQQEVCLFQRNTAIFYMKLKSILARWRLGSRDGAVPDDGAQPEVSRLSIIWQEVLQQELYGGD